MTRLMFVFLLMLALACNTHTDDTPFSPPRPLSSQEKALVSSGNTFSLNFFKSVSAATEGNLMISPLSAYLAMGMVWNGASDETAQELASALGHPVETEELNQTAASLSRYLIEADPDVTFLSKNAVFYRDTFSFESSFFETVKSHYSAEVRPLDYGNGPAAAAEINRWVNTATKGKIPTIVDQVEEAQVMHLINALYFNANWSVEFDKNLTIPRPFYTPEGTVSHLFMERDGAVLSADENETLAVHLPYANGAFEMILLLPPGSPQAFLSGLTPSAFEAWMTGLNSSEQNVVLRIPAFEQSFSKQLVEDFQNLGVRRLFSPSEAQLNRLTKNGGLFVSDVLQKTFIRVDEAGTEAAAVTAVTIEVTSIPDEPRVVVFDRPFVYVIREKYSGALLFMGILSNPAG